MSVFTFDNLTAPAGAMTARAFTPAGTAYAAAATATLVAGTVYRVTRTALGLADGDAGYVQWYDGATAITGGNVDFGATVASRNAVAPDNTTIGTISGKLPADTAAKIGLIATMRGTDDANTTTPPDTSAIATGVWSGVTRTITGEVTTDDASREASKTQPRYAVLAEANNPILRDVYLTDAGSPATGLTAATAGLVAEYKLVGDTTWTAITLQAGTADTWADGSFAEIGGGYYEVGLPVAARESNALVRITVAGNDPRMVELVITSDVPTASTIAESVWTYSISAGTAITGSAKTYMRLLFQAVPLIQVVTDKLRFTGDDVKATLDSEAVTLTVGERNTLADVIDDRLLDAGDATDLIASIVARIGNTNVDEASLVGAIKSALFDVASSANKLAVDATGNVTTDDASRTASQADTSGLATSAGLTAVNNAITALNDYDGTDTTGTTTLLTRLNAARAVLLDNLDVLVSSRASQSAVTALGSPLQSGNYTAPSNAEIAAIKLKTDNLPASPADVSNIPTVSDIQAGILNEGDGQQVIDAIVSAIEAADIAEPALVALIRADLERIGGPIKLTQAVADDIDIRLGTPVSLTVAQRAEAIDDLLDAIKPSDARRIAGEGDIATNLDEVSGGGGSSGGLTSEQDEKLTTIYTKVIAPGSIVLNVIHDPTTGSITAIYGDSYTGSNDRGTIDFALSPDQFTLQAGDVLKATLADRHGRNAEEDIECTFTDEGTPAQLISMPLTAEQTKTVGDPKGSYLETIIGNFDIQLNRSGATTTLIRGAITIINSYQP